MLGTAAQISNLRAYPPGNPYIAVDVMPNFTARPGPHASVVQHSRQSVRASVGIFGGTVASAADQRAGSGCGTAAGVAIAGEQFTPSTQILFDGLPAVIESQSSNLLIVTPPPAPAGYTAAVAAFNADGQSSLFLNPRLPPYTYTAGAACGRCRPIRAWW